MSLVQAEIFKDINLDNLSTIKPFSSSINLEISENNLNSIEEILQDINFYFSLPVILNSNILGKIDSFQVIIQSTETFKEQFSNTLFNSTLDNQSFVNDISSDNREFIDNDLLNFLSQRQENKRFRINNINKVFNFNFNILKVTELLEQTDIVSFDIDFPRGISKDIVTLDEKLTLRIIAFDKEKNILDQTEFFSLEDYYFFDKFNNQEEVDLEKFYANFFIDSSINNIRLLYDDDGDNNQEVIRVYLDNQIDFGFFDSIDISLTYSSSSGNSIGLSKVFNINEQNLILNFDDITDVSSFARAICSDLLIKDKNTFDFDITLDFYVNEISPITEIQSADDLSTRIISAITQPTRLSTRSKSLSYRSNHSFISSIRTRISDSLISEIISNINLQANIEYIGSLVKVFVSFDESIDDNILRKINVESISCNNRILDFVFNGQSTQIENRIKYYDKNLFNLLEDFNPFYFINTFRETNLKINLSLNDVNREIVFDKVIETSSFESLIKETNKFFKEQIEISDFVRNNSLNDLEEKSIQQINQIEVNDLNRLINIAFKSGYVNQSFQGDVSLFLDNMLIKSIISTKIKNADKSFNIQKYHFGSEIFEINISESIINFREDFLRRSLETNDYYLLSNNIKSIADRKILSFFANNNSLEKFLEIDLVDNFSFNVSIKLQFLPFPNEVSKLRGIGIDENNNISVENENITDEELNLTEIETINFLYSNNPNLNWNKFLNFKRKIYEKVNVDTALKFSEMFDYILKNSTNDANYFNQIFNINRQTIKETLSQTNLNSNISSIIFNIPNFDISKRLFNFSLNNEFFPVIENPYTLFFKNNFYNSNNDTFEVEEIIIKNNNKNKLKFDISILLDAGYEISDLKEFEYTIKPCIFPLTSNRNKKIESTIFSNLSKYVYEGEDFVSLSSTYISSIENKSTFSDFNSSVKNRLVSFEENDENVFLVLNTASNLLDFNKIDKSTYKEFLIESKSNQLNILYDFILRYNISVKTNNNKHFCLVNSYKLVRENLKDNVISIKRLDNINTLSFF